MRVGVYRRKRYMPRMFSRSVESGLAFKDSGSSPREIFIAFCKYAALFFGLLLLAVTLLGCNSTIAYAASSELLEASSLSIGNGSNEAQAYGSFSNSNNTSLYCNEPEAETPEGLTYDNWVYTGSSQIKGDAHALAWVAAHLDNYSFVRPDQARQIVLWAVGYEGDFNIDWAAGKAYKSNGEVIKTIFYDSETKWIFCNRADSTAMKQAIADALSHKGESGWWDKASRIWWGSGSAAGFQNVIELLPAAKKIELTKTSAQASITANNSKYSLEGAVYAVFESETEAKKGTPNKSNTELSSVGAYTCTMKTNAAGKAEISGPHVGTYWVREISAPSGFELDSTVHKVEIESGATGSVASTENPLLGSLEIRKSSNNPSWVKNNPQYSLAGAIYAIYSDSTLQDVVKTLTTNKEGYAKAENLEAGTYWVKETSPSPGHALDPTTHKVSVGGGQVSSVKSDEKSVPSSVSAQKVSSKPEWIANYKRYGLAGAVYTIYTDAACTNRIGDMTTNDKGVARKDGLEARTYYVKETKPSAGHNLDTKIYQLNPTPGNIATFTSTDTIRPVYVELYKKSGNTSYTAGNPNYSLEGAQYSVYDSKGQALDTLTTNANGYAKSKELPADTYTVRETKCSKGYTWADCSAYKGGQAHSLDLQPGDIKSFQCSEPAEYNSVETLIQKTSLETGLTTPQGSATLAGTQFSVAYYALDVSANKTYTEAQLKDVMPTRSWVLKTDETGWVGLTAALTNPETYFVSGDTFYTTLDAKKAVLPLGVVTITEIKPPTGYLNSGTRSGDQAIQYIRSSGSAEEDVKSYVEPTADKPTSADQVKRGDVHFAKKDGEQKPLGCVVWKVTNSAQTETHYLVTDENGDVSTASNWTAHSKNTNAYDACINEDGSVDEVKLAEVLQETDGEVGYWFSGGSTEVAVNDNKGALVFDTYTVDELRSSANQGLNLRSFSVTAKIDGRDANLGTVDNTEYEIITCAKDATTGSHYGTLSERAGISDRVEISGLARDTTYKLVSMLYDANLGQVIEGTQTETEFVARASKHNITVNIALDSSGLKGHQIVVFTELYSANGILLAQDCDETNKEETIWYPSLSTSASDTVSNTHEAAATDEVTLQDSVRYEGLDPTETYTLTTELFYTDGTSTGVSQTTTFKPEERGCGSVVVAANLPGADLAGKSVVFTEKLTLGGETVAKHDDLGDERQTISFPGLSTSASDAITKSRVTTVGSKTRIKDTVSYTNLMPQTSYTVVGKLMDKESGEPIANPDGGEVSASVEIVPIEPNGFIEVEFELDTSALTDKEVVVFEVLYKGEYKLVSHEDLNDTEQTVQIPTPSLATEALSETTQNHETVVGTAECIVDSVSYTNLVPDTTYKLRGSLIDKESGEAVANAESEFVVSESAGGTTVVFDVDTAKLIGKTLVAFEELWCGNTLIGEHKDLNDTKQTISVPAPEIRTKATSETGDSKEIQAASNSVTINDEVSYTNLKPGETYKLVGTLVSKSTGLALCDLEGAELVSQSEFTPEARSGTFVLSFTFNPTGIAPMDVVVFEQLYCGNTLIAEHADIEDEDQTVSLITGIKTHVLDSADGDQKISEAKDALLIDTVELKGLVVGSTYRLSASIMDKTALEIIELQKDAPVRLPESAPAKGGEKATALESEHAADYQVLSNGTVCFVAENPEASILVPIALSAAQITGSDIVVFENLEIETVVEAEESNEKQHAEASDEQPHTIYQTLLVHADLEDKDQTITITKTPLERLVHTGLTNPLALLVAVVAITTLGLVSIVMLQKLKHAQSR